MVADCPQTLYSAVATTDPYTITSTVTTTNGEFYTITVTGVGYKQEEEEPYIESDDFCRQLTRQYIQWQSRKLAGRQAQKHYKQVNRKLLKIRSRLR